MIVLVVPVLAIATTGVIAPVGEPVFVQGLAKAALALIVAVCPMAVKVIIPVVLLYVPAVPDHATDMFVRAPVVGTPRITVSVAAAEVKTMLSPTAGMVILVPV